MITLVLHLRGQQPVSMPYESEEIARGRVEREVGVTDGEGHPLLESWTIFGDDDQVIDSSNPRLRSPDTEA
jgi:hypothetical protein